MNESDIVMMKKWLEGIFSSYAQAVSGYPQDGDSQNGMGVI